MRLVVAFDRNYLDELGSPAIEPDRELALGDLVPAGCRRLDRLRVAVQGRFLDAVVINSLGMRDREGCPQKGPETFRVVGLGDSLMFGWGVRQEETFLGRCRGS